MDELSTILGILSNEDLGNKPVVVRIAKNVSGPAGQEANAQVKAALNDAHVAALARLDQAKTNVQAVKAANRQAMQATRDQGQQRLQVAQDAVVAAKTMASKTVIALKAMGLKPARAPSAPAKTEETEQATSAFAVGNVIQLTPVGKEGQLRITPDDRVDANGRNGGLTRFQVMARQGNSIKLARNGHWLRLRGSLADGQGRDAQAPWIQLITHADESVSLVSRNVPHLALTVAQTSGQVSVESLQETDGITKFAVVVADPQARRRRDHGEEQQQRGKGRRGEGRFGRCHGRWGMKQGLRHLAQPDASSAARAG